MKKAEDLIDLIPKGAKSLLDVGCNVGEFLDDAQKRGVDKLFGADINLNAIEQAREEHSNRPEFKFFHCSADEIPLEDNSVDMISCTEVIEHVPSDLRPKAINEFHRILKPNSRLVITVPFDGIFSFLDPSNVRFRVPGLYNKISSFFGRGGRDLGYEGEKHGVVWHQHFSKSELEEMIGSKFKISYFRYRGFLITPLGEWLLFPLYRMQKFESPIFKGIKRVQNWEMSNLFPESLAYNVMIVAES